jgi:hypothetical protein
VRSLGSAAIVIALVSVCTIETAARAPAPEVVGKDEPAAPAVDFDKAKSDQKLQAKILADRAASKGNLRQIGIAFHNWHSAANQFPVDIADKKGKAMLSWRVAILPYVGQEKLYKEFRQDEPWDSAHNLKLLEKMPDVYRSPRVKLQGKGNTVYQLFMGPEAVFGRGQPPTIFRITDGTSNTIMAIESPTATPWTKPGGIPFDRKKALPDFTKTYGNRPIALMCDGSTYLLNLTVIKPETFKNIIDPADGNPLGMDFIDGVKE